MQQINLSEKSLIELKAIAYDLNVEINNLSRSAQIVEQEIINRLSVKKEPEVSKEIKPLKNSE